MWRKLYRGDYRQHFSKMIPTRILVQRNFFDIDKNNPYSSTLPEHINKTKETLIFVYNAFMKKVRVQLDLDSTMNDVKVNDITIEAREFQHKTMELLGISKEHDGETVSIRYFLYFHTLFLNYTGFLILKTFSFKNGTVVYFTMFFCLF